MSVAAPPLAPAATLSFCITTRGPAERVRALLELVRPVADEIVLAVNRDGGLDALDACADLADRRLTYEFADSPSRLIGWVLHQCSADWILRLDDDEVPSAELLRALPHLIRDRRPSLLAIKRRWLHPSPDRMIAQPSAWATEYQPRALRNLPGTWRFDGRVHSDVQVAGERRLVEAPIYHCALVLQDSQARRERALAYELLRPGVAYGDLPVNGLYLPEMVEGVETEPVPEPDRALIGAVLAGSAERGPDPGRAASHASRTDVDAYNSTRVVGPGAYRARLEAVAAPRRMRAGTRRQVQLHVTNAGDSAWPGGETEEPLIRLGYRWREAETERVVLDGRGVFSERLAPGATTLVLLGVLVPPEPGTYELEVDLVHEHVRWFEEMLTLQVQVDPDPRTLLVGSPRLPGEMFQDSLAGEGARLAEALRAATEAAERARADVEGLRAQRRWRAANLLARPFDAARRRGRRR